MVQLCPQVDCTASYHLDENEEGKTFRCDQCGLMLLFDKGTLTLHDGAARNADSRPIAMSVANQEKAPMLTSSAEEKSVASVVLNWFFTFLFAFGSFLVVLFFFLPVIDREGAARVRDRIAIGDSNQARLDNRLFKRQNKGVGLDPIDVPAQPDDAALRRRKNDRAEWEKTRDRLEEEAEEAHNNAMARVYFYTWGIMFGFLILAMASVGFLSFGPTNPRRIFGGIIITAEILLIFAAYFVRL